MPEEIRKEESHKSEEGQFWEAYHEEQKDRKRLKEDRTFEKVEHFCIHNQVTLTIFERWHLRLAKNDTVFDIYPQSQKWFDLKTKQWGRYKKVDDFLKETFGKDASP